MKNALLLMLGLAAGTASFAQENPAASVHVTADQKLTLVVPKTPARATITLRDENGNALFTKTADLTNGILQKFDISQLSDGTYQLTVATPAQTFSKSFVVQPNPVARLVSLK